MCVEGTVDHFLRGLGRLFVRRQNAPEYGGDEPIELADLLFDRAFRPCRLTRNMPNLWLVGSSLPSSEDEADFHK
jgi:hypothetical protein